MKKLTIVFFITLLGISPAVFAFAKKPSPAPSAAAAKKYACPMGCKLSDKPGKCSKCGMEMWEVSQ